MISLEKLLDHNLESSFAQAGFCVLTRRPKSDRAVIDRNIFGVAGFGRQFSEDQVKNGPLKTL